MSAFPIRPARREDAADLAYFINEAGEGLAYWMWSRACGELDPWEWGRQRAARDEGDFSWRNAWVVERDGKVIAMLLGFVIAPADIDLEEIPEIVRPLVKLEQQAVGSWYINALATRPEYRGQGIGRGLIEFAAKQAREANCTALSLQNFLVNANARRLYERAGFREVAREPMPRIEGLPDYGASILHVRALDAKS